jgi:hypothetical protein
MNINNKYVNDNKTVKFYRFFYEKIGNSKKPHTRVGGEKCQTLWGRSLNTIYFGGFRVQSPKLDTTFTHKCAN